jgi:hypothetical protein
MFGLKVNSTKIYLILHNMGWSRRLVLLSVAVFCQTISNMADSIAVRPPRALILTTNQTYYYKIQTETLSRLWLQSNSIIPYAFMSS